VPEQMLDDSNIVAVLQEVSGEAVTQRVRGDGLVGQARQSRGTLDGALDTEIVQMMTTDAA